MITKAKMKLRLKSFLYFFNLRQGVILIAVYQLAASSFTLIILLVSLSHVAETLEMLETDKADDAERHGGYVYAHRPTNNQRRFQKADFYVGMSKVVLDLCTVAVAVHVLTCLSLLHGAVMCKRMYVLPWMVVSTVAVAVMTAAAISGSGYPYLVNTFGGHLGYSMACFCTIITYIYCIETVISFFTDGSFWLERDEECSPSGERGERLLLLDHAAHSSLLSAKQLDKLSHNTRTHFV